MDKTIDQENPKNFFKFKIKNLTVYNYNIKYIFHTTKFKNKLKLIYINEAK